MIIRKAITDEISSVLDLIETFDRDKAPRPSQTEISSVLDNLTRLGGGVLVAELDGKIVGTCTVTICPNLSWSGRPYAMIENVIVNSIYQGKGVGKALLDKATSMANDADCYKVALMTGSNKESTRSFYESAGFTGNKKGFQRRFNA